MVVMCAYIVRNSGEWWCSGVPVSSETQVSDDAQVCLYHQKHRWMMVLRWAVYKINNNELRLILMVPQVTSRCVWLAVSCPWSTVGCCPSDHIVSQATEEEGHCQRSRKLRSTYMSSRQSTSHVEYQQRLVHLTWLVVWSSLLNDAMWRLTGSKEVGLLYPASLLAQLVAGLGRPSTYLRVMLNAYHLRTESSNLACYVYLISIATSSPLWSSFWILLCDPAWQNGPS